MWQQVADDAISIHGAWQYPSEFGPLLALVAAEQPRVVVEIGSYQAGSLYAWSQLPGPPWLLSVDKDEVGMTTRHGAELIQGDSHDPATYIELVRTLGGELIDFLYIDGDHSWAGAMTDYFMYRTLVRPGGLIGVHDISQDLGPAAIVAACGGELVATWRGRPHAMGTALFRVGKGET